MIEHARKGVGEEDRTSDGHGDLAACLLEGEAPPGGAVRGLSSDAVEKMTAGMGSGQSFLGVLRDWP